LESCSRTDPAATTVSGSTVECFTTLRQADGTPAAVERADLNEEQETVFIELTHVSTSASFVCAVSPHLPWQQAFIPARTHSLSP